MKNAVTRRRPEKNEYVEYYHRYIKEVPEGDIIDILRDQLTRTTAFLQKIPEDRIEYRYAPEKWTLREVVGHVIDMEWVFTARAAFRARRARAPPRGGTG